jgi:phenylacetic acid degradation operon negative regulatory protein
MILVPGTTEPVARTGARARPRPSAKALLLTVLGELVLPRDGVAWTGSLVGSLELLGVAEGNARQAIARTGEQGFLSPRRFGRHTRWELTGDGRRLLTSGAERIYAFGSGREPWDDHWLVVLCPVPEDQRAKRHHLRSRLAFAGLGFLTPTVAITPHVDREPAVATVLRDLDLDDAAIVFHAEASALSPARDLLHRAWDLDTLAGQYRGFVAAFARRRPGTDTARFAALVELVHAWRRFPFVDPEIPDRLLPRDWPGHRAKQLFDSRRREWAPDAGAVFESLERAAREARPA